MYDSDCRVHFPVSDTPHVPQAVNRWVRVQREDKYLSRIDVSVVDSGRETPGPIPNPEAKPARADGTALGRVWESRLPPTQ